jgi:hypothetical protein
MYRLAFNRQTNNQQSLQQPQSATSNQHPATKGSPPWEKNAKKNQPRHQQSSPSCDRLLT